MNTIYVTIALLFAIAGMVWALLRTGGKVERGKQAKDDIEAVEVAHEQERDVDRRSDSIVSEWLHKWRR